MLFHFIFPHLLRYGWQTKRSDIYGVRLDDLVYTYVVRRFLLPSLLARSAPHLFCFWREHLGSSLLANFNGTIQCYHLVRVTMLYVTSSDLLRLITESLDPYTTLSLFAPTLPPWQALLYCFYKFGFLKYFVYLLIFKGSTYKWYHEVFFFGLFHLAQCLPPSAMLLQMTNFLRLSNIPLSYFLYLFIRWWTLRFFHTLTTMNAAAVSMGVQISLRSQSGFLLHTQSGTAGSHVSSIFNL